MFDLEFAKGRNIKARCRALLVLQLLADKATQDNPLTQPQIANELKEYGLDCKPRTISECINDLNELIGDKIIHKGRCQGYYLEQSNKLREEELHTLIDSVLFNKNISRSQSDELIFKIESMNGNVCETAGINYRYQINRLQYTDNDATMYNIGAIHKAIEKRKQISFTYNCYEKDKKLHPKRGDDFKYVVNPYYVAVNNGRYYLIGTHIGHDTISHYRIDRMTNLEITPTYRPMLRELPKYSNNYELSQHMSEHIYMYSGDAVSVTLRIKESLLDDIVDWFGKEFDIIADNGKTLDIRLKCNENAMLYWALQYGLNAEVIAPEKLRTKIAAATAEIYEKYHQQENGQK